MKYFREKVILAREWATNEQLLIGLSEDCPRLTELVNRGDYADAPKFVEEIMQEVADKIVEMLK